MPIWLIIMNTEWDRININYGLGICCSKCKMCKESKKAETLNKKQAREELKLLREQKKKINVINCEVTMKYDKRQIQKKINLLKENYDDYGLRFYDHKLPFANVLEQLLSN